MHDADNPAASHQCKTIFGYEPENEWREEEPSTFLPVAVGCTTSMETFQLVLVTPRINLRTIAARTSTSAAKVPFKISTELDS